MDKHDDEREQAQIAAENMELLLEHIEHLRGAIRSPPRSPSPNMMGAAQSWTTLKTIVTIVTVAASFVIATLTVGHWWGVADENFALLKRIDRAVTRVVVQLQAQDHRLRVLEQQRGISPPPDEWTNDQEHDS